MPTLTVTRIYNDGNALTEAMLDAQNDSIETFINTTKLDSTNIQAGGISGSNLAAGSIDSGKLTINAVTTTAITDAAVTTAKIADANVTTAKIVDANVTTAKLADSSVTAAKIADGVITPAKMGSLGQQVSASSGNLAFTAPTSFTDISGQTVTIVGTVRPIEIRMQPDGSGSASYAFVQSASSSPANGFIRLLRDGAELAQWNLQASGASLPVAKMYSVGGFSFIDTSPIVGTSHVYKYQFKVASGSVITVVYAKTIGFSL